MTVADLVFKLGHFPEASEVVFSTRDACPEGYPEWERVSITEEVDGKVYLEIHTLTKECNA